MFDVYARRRISALLLLGVLAFLALRFTAQGDGAQPPRPYAVEAGDTLWGIASAQYGGDPRHGIRAIQDANHLSSTVLRPGMVLLLPAHA